MKIILLKRVQNLGNIGDIKDVNEGYARNFLLPRGLADMATKYSLGVKEAQKKKIERLKQLEEKAKKRDIKKINGKKIVILVKADEKGTLYAGLSKQAIVDAINDQGFMISPDELVLKSAIKKIGSFGLELKVANEKVNILLEIKQDNK